MMFLDCPAYLDRSGTARCGLPAEIEGRYTLASTEGPLEGAKIRCPRGHWFNGPITSLAAPLRPSESGFQDRRVSGPRPAGPAGR
jgi:hypothetical protein